MCLKKIILIFNFVNICCVFARETNLNGKFNFCPTNFDWNRKFEDSLRHWLEALLTDDCNATQGICRDVEQLNKSAINLNSPVWFPASLTYLDFILFRNHGFLYGTLNSESEFTGDSIAYIYPDLKTALVGKFTNGTMVCGKMSKIIAARCYNNTMELKINPLKAVNYDECHFYEPSTDIRYGGSMTLMDPLERRNVYVKKVNDIKGEGLFSKRDIQSGDLISYFYGYLRNTKLRPLKFLNTTVQEWEIINTSILKLENPMRLITPSMDLSKYRATLAHKANHSFNATNSVFVQAYHPRYGEVRGVQAIREIQKNEEILVNYKYDLSSGTPRWYFELYEQEVGMLPDYGRINYLLLQQKHQQDLQLRSPLVDKKY